MNEIKVLKAKDYEIENDSIVKVSTYKKGNMIEIQDSRNYNRRNNISKYKKLNKNEKINTETGEIIQCKVAEEFKTKQDIRNSMKRVEKLILNNFDGKANEVFITLTYEDKETDFNKARRDAENFCRRLQYKYKNVEYIYVIELQEIRKSWHMHLIIKEKDVEKTKITKEEIIKIWKKGEVDVQEINDINGLQMYITKIKSKYYDTEEDDNENKFKIRKGKQIYGCSKEIKMPKEEKMKYKEAKEKVQNMEYKGSNTYVITTTYEDKTKKETDEDRYKNVTLNIIKKEYYKTGT